MTGAAGGTDVREIVRRQRTTALKRFAKWFAIFAPLWLQIFFTRTGYLLPVAILGFLGLAITLLLAWARLSLLRKCSRTFREYPLEFRAPVEKTHLQGPSTLFVRMGGRGEGLSPTMKTGQAVARPGWPEGIEDGVWFAGDDLFGGAAVVPASGTLLFMQPRDWDGLAPERRAAGAERIARAGRAGIKRRASNR
ncbi:hypothetical protein [Streptomyces sp. NPDC001070]